MSDEDAIIRFDELRKSFGPLKVLDGVTVGIRRGETTVIMGPSGTGKSVLLKHIVGLLQPDSGRVYFDGTDLAGLGEKQLNPIRKRIGFLFQLSALFDSMSVYDNVAFPLHEHTRYKESKVREIVEDKLAMVGLEGAGPKMPGELSGGMKKRVALARAIALDPEVILYDEPTTGLDPQRSDVINTLIVRLRQRMQVTSIVVTHDLPCVKKVADRVLMLKGGRIRFDGTYDAITHCQDPEIHGFVTGQASEEDLKALD